MRTLLLGLVLLAAVFVVAAPAAAHPQEPNPCSWSSPDCWVHFVNGDRCMRSPSGLIMC